MRHVVLALLLTLPAATQAGSLGRLFFSPEQRALLEHSHDRDTKPPDHSPPAVLMVDGIVQQHNGARTVWINGTAKNSGQSGELVSETVAVPGKSQPIKIKVGQKLFPGTDTPQSAPASAE